MGPAQTICRLKRISADVQLIEHLGPGTRRLSYSGLSTCKSSLCPLCAPKWQRTRVGEITQAVEHWGARRVLFATLTLRHHGGMQLALQHRLLSRAFGHLWSGRAGQELVAELGGKPESVRAHDRTWSLERGWHPHLHALLFLRSDSLTAAEVEELLWMRWTGQPVFGPRRGGWNGKDSPGALVSALRTFRNFCKRSLARASELDAPWTHYGPTKNGTLLDCGNRRGCQCYGCTALRAKRLFGARLVPKAQPLLDSIRRVSQMLEAFTEQGITPDRVHGVQLESVRGTESAPKYLAKLGLELAWAASKSVNVVDGVTHYPYWALAHLATRHGDPLRIPARRAWRELFNATRGTQAIVFSDRVALGLGPDPYADGNEAPEPLPGELTRLAGLIQGATWDRLKKEQHHGLLVTLATAHERGLIESLPYVDPPHDRSWGDNGWAGVPASRGPPPPKYVPLEAHERAFRVAAAERRGAAFVRAAWDARARAARPPEVWLEELRFKLKQLGIYKHSWRQTERGHPW